jgi:hypothetical protein
MCGATEALNLSAVWRLVRGTKESDDDQNDTSRDDHEHDHSDRNEKAASAPAASWGAAKIGSEFSATQ